MSWNSSSNPCFWRLDLRQKPLSRLHKLAPLAAQSSETASLLGGQDTSDIRSEGKMPGTEFGINSIGFCAGSAAGRKSLDVRRWQLPRFHPSAIKSCPEPPLLTIRRFKTDDSSQMARQFCQPLMAPSVLRGR